MVKMLLVFLILFLPVKAKNIRPYMFTLKDENGETVTLKNFQGNVIYLVFWSKACGKCRKELKSITELYKKYKDKGVVFYAIITDEKSPEKIKKIKKRWKFNIPVLIGNLTVKSRYRIVGTPITYILRKDLTISKIIYGEVDTEKAEKYILRALKEK